MQTQNTYVPASNAFDWLFVIFSGWWIFGVFIDGWAHTHLDSSLETFFTPWHTVFYSGVLAVLFLLFIQLYRNHSKGYLWTKSLPREYMFSLLGMSLVLIGGPGDLIWHSLFGIEIGIEALLSPTHLLLAFGGAMVVSGPLHAIWYRDHTVQSIHAIPVILSFSYFLMTLGFMLQFLHPFNFPWMADTFISNNPINSDYARGLGIANAVIFTGIFMGLVLASVRHWIFPFGSFTLVLGLNALAVTLMHGKYYFFILTALVAGLLIDILYQKFCSLALREKHVRIFGTLAPIILFTTYVVSLFLFDAISWSVHMWAGMILISGITGFLMTYLVISPGDGVPKG